MEGGGQKTEVGGSDAQRVGCLRASRVAAPRGIVTHRRS